MNKGKKWTSEEKMSAILEGLKGQPAREICRERGISEGQYYKWQDEALSGMKAGLKDKRSKEWRDNSWEVERNRLLKMIGEQQLIIDIQKNFWRALTNEQKRKKIDELVEAGLRPAAAIKAMMLTRSSYYYKAEATKDGRKRSLDDQLVRKLNDLAGYELVYGYRKITKSFNEYNHKKVYRHMKELKILQPKKLKKRALTRLAIECPIKSNVRWEGDLTYVWDGNRMNYLFTVMDVYDKDPIGDYYGLRCRAEEAVYSLEEAVNTRFGSLDPADKYRVKLRVDQGSQYLSKKFKKRAKELGVELEYCGINCPNNKPYIETFFSRYKCEEVYRNDYRSFTDPSEG